MTCACARGRPSCGRARHLARLLALAATLLAGCASAPNPGRAAPQSDPTAARQTCDAWFQALDRHAEASGVRDGAAARVAGHAYLRVDRFTASLADRVPAGSDAADGQAAQEQWVGRMVALDRQARQHELANLPPASVQQLAAAFDLAGRSAMHAYTTACGALLANAAFGAAGAPTALRQRLSVPDDYVDAYRAWGLYPLTRIAFLAGVRQFESRTRSRFAAAAGSAGSGHRLLLLPPAADRPGAAGGAIWPDAGRNVDTGNPLGIPLPTPEQAQWLFDRHAPVFDLSIASDDDRPGALRWHDGAFDGPAPRVDVAHPVVYRQLAYTRVGEASLLQLVYTLWFGARTQTTAPIDLLAGRIDGLVWRVTLSPDGVPLIYDSIHPCGCYHMFFPAPGVRARPAPAGQGEWAFSPTTAPRLRDGQRLVLRVAAATHYLEGLGVHAAAPASQADVSYQWRDYDTLRSLPLPGGEHRSMFGPDGFIAGTDRLESWLFWPMGIERAGAMRQWGRQPTAFVGRRHFDDARLLDMRFDLRAALPGD